MIQPTVGSVFTWSFDTGPHSFQGLRCHSEVKLPEDVIVKNTKTVAILLTLSTGDV